MARWEEKRRRRRRRRRRLQQQLTATPLLARPVEEIRSWETFLEESEQSEIKCHRTLRECNQANIAHIASTHMYAKRQKDSEMEVHVGSTLAKTRQTE